MNYFELFDIPVQLSPDLSTLSHKYFELSRKFHPDYYVNASATEQAQALEKSALLNRALKTFRNRDATIRYVLQLKGLLEEEEKFELPPEFLMEVLEINEHLMDTDKTGTPELAARIQELETAIYEPVKEIVEHYQEGSTSREELLQVKEYYFKKKYLDRIKDQLQ